MAKVVDDAIKNTVEETKSTNYNAVGEKRALKLEGGVKEKKKSLGDKFSETFLSEDIGNVKVYVWKDIVVPALKNLLFDSTNGMLQMLIFGNISKPSSGRNGGYRDYNSISKTSSNNYRPVVNDNSRDRFDFRDLVFSSNRDAEEVLYMLYEYIHDYGHATVADYYNAIPGVSSVYTDKDWGWTDLKDVRVQAVRDGFVLTLPRPVYRPDTR